MADDVLEPEHVEYLDKPPQPQQEPTHFYYEGSGCPCFSACGCLTLGILVLVLYNFGAVFSTLIILAIAVVISAALLRLAGINRFSPGYVYLMVPIFLVIMNVLMRIWKGQAPYSLGGIVIGTLVIYGFLWFAQTLGRRPMP